MSRKVKSTDREPGWMNPANDHHTPYTEEEIDVFVEGFIRGLDEQEWLLMKSELGEQKAREKIRAGIVKMDTRNLANITPEGSIH